MALHSDIFPILLDILPVHHCPSPQPYKGITKQRKVKAKEGKDQGLGPKVVSNRDPHM